ncbi:GPI mannosyltransferase 4 [Trichomonascus vanleenenianus]|uniref:glycosylphosphatidylinositol-alpha 1,2 mannosyltransferase n=1 Tax=Trichomonascus vanleenenianus TaxID=2268995 RepID=UPI003ECBA3DF
MGVDGEFLRSRDVFSRSSYWRGVFLLTIVLRTGFALSPSYIHPDEHFQGPEAVADKVFGWATRKPWEFTGEHPARSFLPLYVFYALPMSFVASIFGDESASRVDAGTMFYALRLLFAMGTWVLSDMAIDRLADAKQDKIKGMLFAATSYVTWTYQSHTFSNSIETVVLLWCLVIIHEFEARGVNAASRHFDAAMLGLLVAFGVFNRVTFVAFLVLPGISMLKQFVRYPGALVTCVAFALVMAAFGVAIDTQVYKSSDGYVIAPLNNLLYNLDSENLAVHGLHSRLNHLLVNLPQLLGPGLLFLASTNYLTSLPFQASVSGIALLSLAPHQEPRFLIPVIPLLCLSFDTSRAVKHFKKFFSIWLVFNLILGVLMGTFHQGGVVPAQTHIGKNLTRGANTFIWWKTYSPPIWLMGQPEGTVDVVYPLDHGSDWERYAPVAQFLGSSNYTASSRLTVVDLMGAPGPILSDVVTSVTKVSRSSSQLRRSFLIAPMSSFYGEQGLYEHEVASGRPKSAGPFRLNKVWHTTTHLSLDDIDFSDLSSLKLGLGIWEIQSV